MPLKYWMILCMAHHPGVASIPESPRITDFGIVFMGRRIVMQRDVIQHLLPRRSVNQHIYPCKAASPYLP